MLRNWLDRLQELWVQNTRNRLIIMVSTAVVAILLLCACLNLLGVAGSGVVNSLFTAGPQVRPTIQTGTQVANVNPTFPLPSPTVYNYPNPPAQNVPSSNTPPPTPTPSPTPSVTPTQTGGGINYQISPDPSGRAFTAGVQNTIALSGPPTLQVSVSVFLPGGNNSCLSMIVMLDATGQGSTNCTIPAQLKGTQVMMAFVVQGGQNQQFPVAIK